METIEKSAATTMARKWRQYALREPFIIKIHRSGLTINSLIQCIRHRLGHFSFICQKSPFFLTILVL